MKATGEVMSICTNFEGALMKAIRSLEQHVDSLMSYDFYRSHRGGAGRDAYRVDDMRIWRIAEALRRGISYEDIHDITKIDCWFIDKLAILVEMENALKAVGRGRQLTPDLLREAKRIEFPDNVIAAAHRHSQAEIKKLRYDNGHPGRLQDGGHLRGGVCGGDALLLLLLRQRQRGGADGGRKKVLVLGSGPIRIGQGIEFDFCSVHSTWAFQQGGL